MRISSQPAGRGVRCTGQGLLKDSTRKRRCNPPRKTAKPRSLTWASVPSRLTESNRRPTHYESVPERRSTAWSSCRTWRPGPPSSGHARWFGCSLGCSTGSCSCSDAPALTPWLRRSPPDVRRVLLPGSAPDPARFCAEGARVTEVRQAAAEPADNAGVGPRFIPKGRPVG